MLGGLLDQIPECFFFKEVIHRGVGCICLEDCWTIFRSASSFRRSYTGKTSLESVLLTRGGWFVLDWVPKRTIMPGGMC